MRRIKSKNDSDKIKQIELEIKNYKKKRKNGDLLNKVQIENGGNGACWNTAYYICSN